MAVESQRPARAKYREAAFFRRKLARAEDGHLRTDGTLDADEFQFYCSAFCSATDEIHRQAEATGEDHQSFAEWGDEEARALKTFFDAQCHDVVTVQKTWDEQGESQTEADASTGQTLATPTVRYCTTDAVDVPDALQENYGTGDEGVPIADLAAAYLDSLDAWLSEAEASEETDESTDG